MTGTRLPVERLSVAGRTIARLTVVVRAVARLDLVRETFAQVSVVVLYCCVGGHLHQ